MANEAKLLHAIEQTRAEFAGILGDSFGKLTMAELIDQWRTACDTPEEFLAYWVKHHPKDAAAMIAWHALNELFRRIELDVMS